MEAVRDRVERVVATIRYGADLRPDGPARPPARRHIVRVARAPARERHRPGRRQREGTRRRSPDGGPHRGRLPRARDWTARAPRLGLRAGSAHERLGGGAWTTGGHGGPGCLSRAGSARRRAAIPGRASDHRPRASVCPGRRHDGELARRHLLAPRHGYERRFRRGARRGSGRPDVIWPARARRRPARLRPQAGHRAGCRPRHQWTVPRWTSMRRRGRSRPSLWSWSTTSVSVMSIWREWRLEQASRATCPGRLVCGSGADVPRRCTSKGA